MLHTARMEDGYNQPHACGDEPAQMLSLYEGGKHQPHACGDEPQWRSEWL